MKIIKDFKKVYRILGLWHVRNAPRYLLNKLAVRIITPEIQKNVPFLSKNLKIDSSTKISLITTCGNRLENLKEGMHMYLNQNRKNYEVLISVYADKEGAAEYLKKTYDTQIKDGLLKIIETDAKVFNKSRALNIAVSQVSGDYIFLIDCDCYLKDEKSINQMICLFNLYNCFLTSFGFMGQMLVKKEHFINVGGYDARLRDIWAPDDSDFIARCVMFFKRRFIYFNKTYNLMLLPEKVVIQRRCKNESWIDHTRQSEGTIEMLKDTKYWKIMGRYQKRDRNKELEAMLKYFERKNPKIKLQKNKPLKTLLPFFIY